MAAEIVDFRFLFSEEFVVHSTVRGLSF